MARLYVGNLPFAAEEEHLKEIFSQAGEVTSVRIISDRITGLSKGFGFVDMSSEAEAEKAIELYNGAYFDGRELRVAPAKPDSTKKDALSEV